MSSVPASSSGMFSVEPLVLRGSTCKRRIGLVDGLGEGAAIERKAAARRRGAEDDFGGHAAFRPWSRSAMMSATSSMPTDSRTTSGPAPACTFCASDNWLWVVEAGMDDQRAGVADIGEMREQLDVRDQLHAGVVAALERRR